MSLNTRATGRRALALAACLGLCWPLPAQAAPPEAPRPWAAIGLQAGDAPAVEQEVEALREALESIFGPAGGRSREETALRLGAPPQGRGAIVRWIEQAELQLFQFQLPEAEALVLRAIDALTGQPGPWVRDELRRAHLILATLRLVQPERVDELPVIDAWMPLARVRAEIPLDSRIPPDLLPLLREARLRAEGEAHGWLRFDCAAACPGAVVLANSFPVGRPGEDLPLPAGRYRVLLQDSFEEAGRVSLPREVEVRAGELSRVELDWELEASLEPGGGPAWRVQEGRWEEAARFAAGRLEVERLWGVLAAGAPGGGMALWLWEGESGRLRSAPVEAGATGALDWEQAVRALSGAAPAPEPVLEEPPAPEPAPEGPPAVAAAAGDAQRPRSEAPPYLAADPPLPGSASGDLKAARWLGATASLLAWGTGGWLLYDADRRASGLGALQLGPGHFESTASARSYDERTTSIRSQQKWGSGVLAGAAALSLGTLVLFLVED